MAEILKASCIQMNGGPDVGENLRVAEGLVRKAAGQGAKLIATPENTDRIASDSMKAGFEPLTQETHPGIPFFSSLADELEIFLLVGSMGVRLESGKSANRSFLFAPDGKLAAQYDKIHLFDVNLPTGESHRESDRVQAGNAAVVAETPFGGIGLSICYDLRFAYLYRALAQKGANILTIPSAFTVPTGKAHWEILLRARAIETGSFVLAPAQTGEHAGGRRTYGHSMIVGPWGQILAQAENEVGVLTAELHLNDVAKARQAIPALRHDRSDILKAR